MPWLVLHRSVISEFALHSSYTTLPELVPPNAPYLHTSSDMDTPAERAFHGLKCSLTPNPLMPQTSKLRYNCVSWKQVHRKQAQMYTPFVFGTRCLKTSLDKKTATNNTLIYYSGNILLSLKSDDIKLNQLPELLWIILTVPVAHTGSYKENKHSN